MNTNTNIIDTPAPLKMDTRFYRLIYFLNFMFPPLSYIPFGIANFFAIYFAAQLVGGENTLTVTGKSLLGAMCFVLLSLLMRVYDEIKDVDNDLRMGKLGDPRYKNRPIVTGHLKIEDLFFLRNSIQLTLLIINVLLGWPHPLLEFIILFSYMWLSSKWFFYPSIKNNLLVAFVTHNPIAFLFAIYCISFYQTNMGNVILNSDYLLLAFAFWMPVASWEVCRKIRLPDMETQYQTYSMMLGWRTAVITTMSFIIASALAFSYLATRFAFGQGFLLALYVATSVFVLRCLHLLLAPTASRTKLQPLNEAVGLIICVGLIIVVCYHHPMQFLLTP